MMGEIDTKPIEPVRSALSLFGDRGDQKKYQSPRNKRDCENELEDLSKELANCKVQLEAKHAAHMQALLKLEHNQKMTYELSTLLKKSDIERNRYMNECTAGRARIDELESKMKEMADQPLETAMIRNQLSDVLSELKATQRELLNKETELVAARDSELKALSNLEQLETAFKIEKEQKEELLQRMKELNEAIHRSKLAAIKAEKEKLAMLSEKDEKLKLATKATAQAQKQLEDLSKQIDMLQGLQNQPMEKSILVDSLPLEFRQANEALILSEELASNAINDSNQFHKKKEPETRNTMDQSVYIEALEMELNELKQELSSAKEEINGLNISVESLTGDLHKIKAEQNMNKEREIEAQVEIACPKCQLQGGRSVFAGMEAAEEREENVKSGLDTAVEQLSVEAEEVKKEDQQREHELADMSGYVTENPSQGIQASQTDHSKAEAEERNNENNFDHITISYKDYISLVREAGKAKEAQASVVEVGSQSESAFLKRELELASVKIAELRARAEQALSRAESAEKSKATLEDKLKRQREHRNRGRAALAALKEESTPKQSSPSTSDGTPRTYQPLCKVLNMKL